MKGKLGVISLLAMAMAMSGSLSGGWQGGRYIEPEETDEEKKQRLAKAEIEKYDALMNLIK